MQHFKTVTHLSTRSLLKFAMPSHRSNRLATAGLLGVTLLSAGSAMGQQAYFSIEGEITSALGQHRMFFNLPTGASTTDTLFFRSYRNAGLTTAAGDPTQASSVDPILDLFSSTAFVSASNDDGATGPNSSLDSLLSWPGVAESGGTLPGTGLPAANDYRLTLSDFDNNSTGYWAVDAVGPASKLILTQLSPTAANPGGVSVIRSLKFGTTGVGLNLAIFDYIGLTDLQITNDLVLNNRSLLQQDQGEITVGGTTTINSEGNYNLTAGTLDLDGNLLIDSGAMSVSSAAILDRAIGTNLTISNGGSLTHNPGTVFNGTTLDVISGGVASFSGFFGVGTDGSLGSIFVADPGSSFTINSGFNTFWAQNGGTAILTVRDDASANISFASDIDLAGDNTSNNSVTFDVLTGGDLTISSLNLADGAGTNNFVIINVDGVGSTLTQTGSKTLKVGGSELSSVADINISNSGVYTTGTGLTTVNANGSVDVTTGGTFNIKGDLLINGGSVAFDATSTFDPDGNITVDGGTLNVAGLTSQIFSLGTTFTAQNGGQATITAAPGNAWFVELNQSVQVLSDADLNYTGQFTVGAINGTGSLNVSGNGSTFNLNGLLVIAQFESMGTMTVQDNASVQISSQIQIATIFNQPGANGLLDIKTGGEVTSLDIFIGHIDGEQGTGTINVNGLGSTLTQTGTSDLLLGNADTPNNGGVHTINVTGSGIFDTGTGTTTIRKTGTLNINTDGKFNANGNLDLVGGTINASYTNGATGTGLRLPNGGTLTASAGAQINITGNGPSNGGYDLINSATFHLTDGADLTVTNDSEFDVGQETAGTLIVDGVGTTLNAGGNSDIGVTGGTGNATFRNGATGTFNSLDISQGTNSTGLLTIQSGAQVDVNSTLNVFSNGTIRMDNGTLEANNGLNFFNGTLHTVFSTNTNTPVRVTSGNVTINSSATLKIELAPGYTPAVNHSFAILASNTSTIPNAFANFVGQGIGGGLYFRQFILSFPGESSLLLQVEQTSPADLDYDGDVDDADFGIAFAAFTGPGNGPSSNPLADLDTDGDVDDADFGIAFAAFTGPGGGPASVPEPASLAIIAAGALLTARRRRA